MKYTVQAFTWERLLRFSLVAAVAVCFVVGGVSDLWAAKNMTGKTVERSLPKGTAIEETVVNVGRVHCFLTNSTSEKATGTDDQTFLIGHSNQAEPSMMWLEGGYAQNHYLYNGPVWFGMQDTDGQWKAVKLRAETTSQWRIRKKGVDPDAIGEMDVLCTMSDQSALVSDLFKLNIEVTQKAYAWSESYRDDFIIFEYVIRNIGTDDREIWLGFHQDTDISAAAGGSGVLGNWRDDMCNYYRDDAAGEYISYMYDGDNLNIPGNDTGGAFNPRESLGYIGSRLIACPPTTTGLPANTQSGHAWWDWNSDPNTDADLMAILTDPSWLAETPSAHDYRFFAKTGPFDIPVGDSATVVFGYGIGEGLDGLRQNLDWAYLMYHNDWRAPSAPNAPSVTIEPGDGSVTLSWGTSSEASIDPLTGEADFEGYRVYRSADAVNWELLGDFDVINDQGENTGVVHQFVDTDVVNGYVYYYSVSAYDRYTEGLGSLETGKQADLNAQPGAVATGNLVTEGADGIHVVPNPFIKKAPWDFAPTKTNPNEERLQFVNLPGVCTVKVFSLAGDFIVELENDDPDIGYIDWDLITRNTQKVVSGIYLYVVESDQGSHIGKFVVVR